MDTKLAEKFLENECSPKEARTVMNWLATEEGEQYLRQRLDEDAQLLRDERLTPFIPEIDSRKMWDRIDRETAKPSPDRDRKPHRRSSFSWWHVAAAMLIMAASSVFYMQSQDLFTQNQNQQEPMHYVTSTDQHQKLTLGDGTEIRLNSNSQLWIPPEFGKTSRTVRLEGEAFFNVAHDEEHSFVVQTSNAIVKDLGTAFNVKASPGEENVQIAVTEGKVTIRTDVQDEAAARELVEGQYAYLDLQDNSLAIDEFGISNYLSWMNGRFKFEDASLEDVCKQLHRIYGVSFNYGDTSLKSRQLTTNFERDSLTKVLDVIALTLDISYEKNEREIMWSPRKKENKVAH